MANKDLVKFVRESRKRGFDDYQIREPLLNKGWSSEEIEKAFFVLRPKYRYKNKVSIFLDSELLKHLQKRADKNMLTLSEQIEDVLRRSCVNKSKTSKPDKDIDDLLVKCFSRAQRKKKN